MTIGSTLSWYIIHHDMLSAVRTNNRLLPWVDALGRDPASHALAPQSLSTPQCPPCPQPERSLGALAQRCRGTVAVTAGSPT